MLTARGESVTPDMRSVSSSYGGDDRAINLMQELPFFNRKEKKGLKSGSKAKDKGISAVRQLSTGKFNDELLAFDQKGFPPVQHSRKGKRVAEMMREKVSRAYHERPMDRPKGAAAISRLLGTGDAPSPASRDNAKKSAPRRGDIWPAVIVDIALPPIGTRPVMRTCVSETAAAYLKNFKEKTLRPTDEQREMMRDRSVRNEEEQEIGSKRRLTSRR